MRIPRLDQPADSELVELYGLPGEDFLSPILATDWLQYLALLRQLGRTEATYASRFWLYLTTRRLLIMAKENLIRPLYEVPLAAVTDVSVTAPPGREGRVRDIFRKLYQVETVRIVHEAETPTTKVMFYDAAMGTRPFASKLQEYVRAAGGTT